jgi:CRP-like cAMP-binding protein
MKEYFELLKTVALFRGLDEDLSPLLSCLGAKTARYAKNQTVFTGGEEIHSFGIVLSGQVQVFQDDFYGNRSIFANLGPGNLFGEAFACAGVKSLPVSIISTAESALMFLDCRKLSAPSAKACDFHKILIQNLLNILAEKNIDLTQKIEITSKRTTRDKLLAYLSAEAKRTGHSRFRIPYNRQELADYLSVDRSAMSSELGKLRDEGVLRFDRSEFTLM